MSRSFLTLPIAMLLVSLSAGCTRSDVAYPSLLPRAIEGRSDAVPERAVAPARPHAALDRRIADLRAGAMAADRDFAAAAVQAARLATLARRSAEGSEAWLDAQVAIAALDVARTEIDGPLADLERLAIDRAAAGEPPYPALDAAQGEVEALATAQRERIAEIAAPLN